MRASAVIVLVLLIGLPVAQAATETQISQSVLDPTAPYRFRLHASSSGSGYLIAWEEASVLNTGLTTIRIRAIDAAGVPLGTTTTLGTGLEPRIVWNGHEYFVVWGITTPTGGPGITPSLVGVRVREDGSLIDSQPVTLFAESNPFSTVTTVDWNGSQYLVTWNRGMLLVDADLLHSTLVLLPSLGGTPLYAATSGGSFIVLLQLFLGYSTATLYLLPVSAAGELGNLIPLKGARGNIVGVDGGYAMILDDEVNLTYSRLRADATPISASVVAAGGNGFPRLATREGRLVASWESIPDSSHTRVCTARLDIATQPVCSAVTAGLQHDPAIATSSTSVLSAWSENTNAHDTVRVLATPLSDTPRVALGAGRSADIAPPVPAVERRSDGSIAAAWTEYNQATTHFEVHLGGMTAKGARLPDRAVFATAFDQPSPVMAAGAGRTIVLWTEGTDPAKIRMTIVDDASKTVIATLPLANGVAPAVIFDGKEWLVTWQSRVDSAVVQFAFVNSDGGVLVSGTMPSIAASPIALSQTSPAVAGSGAAFFVAWRESAPRGQPAADRIQLSTISAAGAPSLPLTLDSADAALAPPSVASNGNRVLVSWGRPGNTLRQALFDSTGKQLGKFIDYPWPDIIGSLRTHAMAGGFATLAGNRVALTSTDGTALGTMDVAAPLADGDFTVDATNLFTFIYSRTNGKNAANFAQTIGLPRRRPQNR
jgi:hypothetical protein